MEDRKMKPRPRKGRRKVCQFCVDKVEHIDYKDAAKLRKFITERGKIMPRRMSGVCAEHQRALIRNQICTSGRSASLRSGLIIIAEPY